MSRRLDWEKANRREMDRKPYRPKKKKRTNPISKQRQVMTTGSEAICWDCGKVQPPGTEVVFYPKREMGTVRCLPCIEHHREISLTETQRSAYAKAKARNQSPARRGDRTVAAPGIWQADHGNHGRREAD